MAPTVRISDLGWLRQDIPQIAEMIIRCGEEYNPGHNWRNGREWYHSWLRSTFNTAGHYFHVVRVGPTVVAIAGLAVSNLEGFDGNVHSVYVDPQYRGRGFGRLVTEKVLDYARSVHMISLEMALTTNPVARQLYASLGFSVVDDLMVVSLD